MALGELPVRDRVAYDDDGLVSRPWLRWLNALREAVNTAIETTVPALDATLTALIATVAALTSSVSVSLAALTARIDAEHDADGAHNWQWTDTPFADLTFSGSGAMTWGVDAADLDQHLSGRLGDLLDLTFKVSDSDVGGTPSNQLLVSLPPGLVVVGEWIGALRYEDAGVSGVGIVLAVDGNAFVRCIKFDFSDWTATTGDNTMVGGSIRVRVGVA